MPRSGETTRSKAETSTACFTASLQGEFRIDGPGQKDLTPRSQKSAALLAMLLVTQDHSKSRAWLREHLWSDRGTPEGLSSLRQCLSEIRKIFADYPGAVDINRSMVRLNMDFFEIKRRSGDFLENLSIQDPAYLAWVDDMRLRSPYSVAARIGAQSIVGPDGNVAITPPRVQFTYPTVAVEADALDHVTPDIAQAIQQMRIKLTKFRWLSVQSGVPGSKQFDYSVRLGKDSGQAEVNHVSLTTSDGQILWSERDGDEESYPVDMSFLDGACGNIAVLIANTEEQRAATAPNDMDLCNLLWRGRWHLNHMSRADAEQAKLLFRKAQTLAPYDADVAIDQAYLAVAQSWVFRLDQPALQKTIQIAKQVTARVPNDARPFSHLSSALCFAGELANARIALDEAIRLCPNMAMAYLQQGCNMLAEGRFEDAVSAYHRFLTVGRFERRSYIPRCGLAMAHLYLGDNDTAIATAERAIALRPGYWFAHMVHGVASWRKGDKDEARHSLAMMRKIHPKVTRHDVEWLPNGDKEALNRLVLDAGLG